LTVVTFVLLFLLISSFSLFLGYRIVQRNRHAAMMNFQLNNNTLDEFDHNHHMNNNNYMMTSYHTVSSSEGRTWLQYLNYKFHNQIESSVSAITLVYWISKMFTPAINSAVRKLP
jgi:hypothetical protein